MISFWSVIWMAHSPKMILEVYTVISMIKAIFMMVMMTLYKLPITMGTRYSG